jgi:hypothetical protein
MGFTRIIIRSKRGVSGRTSEFGLWCGLGIGQSGLGVGTRESENENEDVRRARGESLAGAPAGSP